MVTLGKTRWGICHIIQTGAEGRLVHCRRNPATCKFCHEHGVPQSEPDPFDLACSLLRTHWDKQWLESDRLPGQGWWVGGTALLLGYDGPWEGAAAARFVREQQQGVFDYWEGR